MKHKTNHGGKIIFNHKTIYFISSINSTNTNVDIIEILFKN